MFKQDFALIKDLWNFKLDFFLSIISISVLGVFTPFEGLVLGKCINGLNSKYQTVRYDESLKYSIIYLILSFGEAVVTFFTFWSFYNLGINLAKMYRNRMMKKYLSFHLSYYDIVEIHLVLF